MSNTFTGRPSVLDEPDDSINHFGATNLATASDDSTLHRNPIRLRALLAAAIGYFLFSMILWSNIWSVHPTSTTLCGCGDSSLDLWFIEWPAYALSHGFNPLYSSAMFFPHGLNLTFGAIFGLLLAPVTWLFGPIASFNLLLILSPVASALAMFYLLQRFVIWTPAAFVGGLFYGFSLFVFMQLTNASIDFGLVAIPPLIVACLDDLFFADAVRPVRAGLLLGLLISLQFFIGTELLAMLAISGLVGTVLIAAYGLLRDRAAFRRHARHACVGLFVGAATAVLILAFPAWYALYGPAHLSGPIWPASTTVGIAPASLVVPATPSTPHSAFAFGSYSWNHVFGGYQGTVLADHYFGIGAILIVLIGCIAFRRDRRLWIFGALGLFALGLSFGTVSGYPSPWQFLDKLPFLQDMIPGRFIVIAYLSIAALLAIVIDDARHFLERRLRANQSGTVGGPRTASSTSLPQWSPTAFGLMLAAIALLPPFAYLAETAPFTAQPVVLPTWFHSVAPRLPGHQVLLVFPAPFTVNESSLTWQAIDQMHYSIVGGNGPGAILSRAGAEAPGQSVLFNTSAFAIASPSASANAEPTQGDLIAVRNALHGWGVTMVVIPDQHNLPPYDHTASVTLAAALITAATGESPVLQSNAWVWSGVDHARRSKLDTSAQFASCVKGRPNHGTLPVESVVNCVLAN